MQIIPSSKINFQKWNACVQAHEHGLLYAHTDYLQAMSVAWYGLVLDDYATILPITIKQKWGIQYWYQPPFMQQLGFIGKAPNNAAIKAVQDFVSYGSPYLNFGHAQVAEALGCKPMHNFILPLQQPFSSIEKQYKKSIHYSLHKAQKMHLSYQPGADLAAALKLYQQYNLQHLPHVSQQDYQNLYQLLLQLQQHQQLLIRQVVNQQQQLQCLVVLAKDDKRYYNLINYTTPEGRKNEANYWLYHQLLQELSHQPMIFDFEGSHLPGIRQFYQKFGAIEQPYFHWHYNHLPWPIRLFKQ